MHPLTATTVPLMYAAVNTDFVGQHQTFVAQDVLLGALLLMNRKLYLPALTCSYPHQAFCCTDTEYGMLIGQSYTLHHSSISIILMTPVATAGLIKCFLLSHKFCGPLLTQNRSCAGSSSDAQLIGYYESWSYTRPCDAWAPENITAGAW
jgi:hypothetical protein